MEGSRQVVTAEGGERTPSGQEGGGKVEKGGKETHRTRDPC